MACGTWRFHTKYEDWLKDNRHKQSVDYPALLRLYTSGWTYCDRRRLSKGPTEEELSTVDDEKYKFYANSSGLTRFDVRAPNDAHVALASVIDNKLTPVYEIIIGGWNNTKTTIRKEGVDHSEAKTTGILESKEFRGFWIRWENQIISVGHDGNETPFLNWADKEFAIINFVGFRTCCGASGYWRIEDNIKISETGEASAAAVSWVPSSKGKVPSDAFSVKSIYEEQFYVVRAKHENQLIPGVVYASSDAALVSWNAKSYRVENYEVLCNVTGKWVPCIEDDIPIDAYAAGFTHDGDVLYVGGVRVGNATIMAKVHPKHKRAYASINGLEVSFKKYLILVPLYPE